MFSFKSPYGTEIHHELPDIGFEAPDQYLSLSETEQQQAFLSDELSIVAGQYFVRTVLLLPIQGTLQDFGWGVWAQVEKDDYLDYQNYLESPQSATKSLIIGRLANRIEALPDTLGLEVRLEFQDPAQRPQLKLLDGQHDLNQYQKQGVELSLVLEWVQDYLRPPGASGS